MADPRESRSTFIKFIAYLQVIGIILVVFGHSFHQYPGEENELLIYRLCFSFRMPLFMFVSGFLMMFTEFMRGKESSLLKFGSKKIRRLLIPYIVLTLVTYFPRASMSGLADDEISFSAVNMLKSLFITDMLPIPYFWFIQASFILLISTYTVIYLCKRFRIADSVAFTILIVISVYLQCIVSDGREIFGYHQAIYFSSFFIAGMAFCRYFDIISKHLPLNSFLSFGITFTIWIISFFQFEGTPYKIITSFFGIFMCISFARLLVKHNVTILDHIIGSSYMIFLLSWYFNVVTQQVLSHYVSIPWQIHTLLSLFFGIYIPWLWYVFLRNHQHQRWAQCVSFLLGQSFRLKK